MHSHRDQLAKQMMRHAADFFARESNRTSLITITNYNLSPDTRNATLLVSVLPEGQEENVVAFMNRRAGDFRDYLKKHVKTKIIPYVKIEIDRGEKNRQLIDQLLKKE